MPTAENERLVRSITLRPLAQDDAPELRRIQSTPEVARWWALPEEDFPFDEPGATRLRSRPAAVAGMIQYCEETEPRYRCAAIDLLLDPALHGRGVGTEAILQVVRHLIRERGHHRITIDPAATNSAAIRSYEKAGFKVVGVMRQYERDAAATAGTTGC